MRPLFVYLFSFFCMFANAFAFASPASLYLEQQGFANSEAVPLSFISKKWQSDHQTGEFSEGLLEIENGVRIGDAGYAFLYRYDIQAKYHPDTIDFFFNVKNRLPLEDGRTYTLAMEINQFRAFGVRGFRRMHVKKNLSFDIGVSLLRAHFVTLGSMRGEVSSLTAPDYDFNFDVDYSYSEDYLFDRPVQGPTGWGVATDVTVRWKPLSQLDIEFAVQDALGFIVWPEAPHTQASADSSVKRYDENGYQYYQPVMSGKESHQRVTQQLRPRIRLSSTYASRMGFLATGQIFTIRYQTYLDTGIGYKIGNTQLVLSRIWGAGAYQLSVRGKYWHLAIAADHSELDKTHSAVANLGFSIPLHW
ncbi:MAG: DUF5723 family protein [Gammaproteobacteria bacterium]|nr:DUF5723 family protein [Gammaproteobacteria bacterium]